MLIPWCLPAWTLKWQIRHSGTCLRLILAIFWSKELSSVFNVLMCLTWCISTCSGDPQLAQGCPYALVVETFQLRASSGSCPPIPPKKRMGLGVRGGHSKFSKTYFRSFLVIFICTFSPNLRRKPRLPICSFLQIVLRRLSLSIQWSFTNFARLSTKL